MEHRRSAVSDLLGRTPGPVQKVLDRMPQAAAIRREAFRALRRGETPDATVLAERCGIPVSQIAQALDPLRSVGAVQVDDRGRVVAIGGLSTQPTRHRLVLSGTPFYTWCAIDALGIPAALEEDALVATSCQHCGRAVEIPMREGR
ncbi:MAG: organomercurial lyase, partial [Armatimonadota bacterium]